MSGINYKSQINMPVAPTEDNHVTRLRETKKATFDDTLSVAQIFKNYATPTGGPPYTQPDNFIEAHGDMKIYGSGSVTLVAAGTNASTRVHQHGVTLRSARFTDWGEDIGLLSEGSAKMFGKQYTTIQSEQQIHIHTHGNEQQVRLACGNTAGLELKRDWQGNQVCEIYTQDKIYLGSQNCEINGTNAVRLSAGIDAIYFNSRTRVRDLEGNPELNLYTLANDRRVWVACGDRTSLQLNNGDGTIYSADRSRLYALHSEVYGTDSVTISAWGDNWQTQGVRINGNVWINEGAENRVVKLKGYLGGNELELGTSSIRMEGIQHRAIIKGYCNPLATTVPAVDIVANEGSWVRIAGTTLASMRFATTMTGHDSIRDFMAAMHGKQWEDIAFIRVKNMSTSAIAVGRRNETRFTVGDATPIQAYGTTTTIVTNLTNAQMEDFYPARALRGTINAQSGTQWYDHRFISHKGNSLLMCRGDDTPTTWGGYAIKPDNQMSRPSFVTGGGTFTGGVASFTFGVDYWETFYRPQVGITAAYGDWNANIRFELWTRN